MKKVKRNKIDKVFLTGQGIVRFKNFKTIFAP